MYEALRFGIKADSGTLSCTIAATSSSEHPIHVGSVCFTSGAKHILHTALAFVTCSWRLRSRPRSFLDPQSAPGSASLAEAASEGCHPLHLSLKGSQPCTPFVPRGSNSAATFGQALLNPLKAARKQGLQHERGTSSTVGELRRDYLDQASGKSGHRPVTLASQLPTATKSSSPLMQLLASKAGYSSKSKPPRLPFPHICTAIGPSNGP